MSKKSKAREINDKQASFASGGTSDHSNMTEEEIKKQEEGRKRAEKEKGHPMLGGSNNPKK